MTPGAWNYSGIASGNVTFHVQSPPQYGTKSAQMSIVSLPLRVKIIPTPPRSKRVVWDVLHSIKYPPGYVPRDNLDVKVRPHGVLGWVCWRAEGACRRVGERGVELLQQPERVHIVL